MNFKTKWVTAALVTYTTILFYALAAFQDQSFTQPIYNGIGFFTATNPGIVSASGGGTSKFLRADDTWQVPGGGSGPCTSVANSVQYNNAGAFGCFPMIDNSGVPDFTTSSWQINGATMFYNTGGGGGNIAIGGGTFNSLTSGAGNFCEGWNFSGLNLPCNKLTSGTGIVAIGFGPGNNVTSGHDDVYIGSEAGASATTDFQEVCLGLDACQNLQGGVNDEFIGAQSGPANGSATAVTDSACIGADCLFRLTGGANWNNAFGYLAGEFITSGTGDLCIGNASCVGSTSLTTGSNDVMIYAGGGNSPASSCSPSSTSVNNEWDFCGTGSDTLPWLRVTDPSLATGNAQFNMVDADPGYVVASLPSSPPTGSKAYVTDATGCNVTLTGGGSTKCQVWYNGSQWTSINPSGSAALKAWGIFYCNNGGSSCTTSGQMVMLASYNLSSTITFNSSGNYSFTVVNGVNFNHGGVICGGSTSTGVLICGINPAGGVGGGDITGTNPSFTIAYENTGGVGADTTTLGEVQVFGSTSN